MLIPIDPPADAIGELRTVPLLASLGPESLERVARDMEWLDVAGGIPLFRQGDPPDGVYFVLGGRVRVSSTDGRGVERTLDELGRGEPFGELGLLESAPRSVTVTTIRRSLLVRMPIADFERLVEVDTAVALSLSRTVARHVRSSEVRHSRFNVIAVVTTLDDAGRATFIEGLCGALSAHGTVDRIDVSRFTGGSLRAAIDRAEAAGALIVADVGRAMDDAAAEVLRESDRVLVAVDATVGPGGARNAALWQVLDRLEGHTGAELVLMHGGSLDRPGGTARWLSRYRFRSHHHVRIGATADLGRLARHLHGTSVCLVLGGGGAKAFAHIGVYQALLENGVPIDRVGGSSMGAVMAAQIAAGMSPEQMRELNGQAWRAARIRRLGLPVVSLLSPRPALPVFHRLFEDRSFEDLWVPCFATTVDLNACRLVAHSHGALARWVRASSSPPGIWPPVLGDDGSLHVDGGVLDNLPVRTMRHRGPGRLVAVNVSPYQPMLFQGLGRDLPGSVQLLRGLLTARSRGSVPNIVKILYRAVEVTSLETQSAAMAASDLYIEPDVKDIGLTDYHRIDEIAAAGYDATRRELDGVNPFGQKPT